MGTIRRRIEVIKSAKINVKARYASTETITEVNDVETRGSSEKRHVLDVL